MMYLTKNNIKQALSDAGIKSGDTILVHSDIASFGTMENFSRKSALEMFYNAFIETIGNEGTLCTPAYFYEYGQNIPFDIELSPVSKELGVFAKYINSLPNRKRSCHPITSIAAVGKNADFICEIKNRHAYGEDSVFDKLYNIDAKIVVLGTSFCPITFIHYIQYRVGVPQRYNKFFNTPILKNGEVVFENSFSFVRYLDIEYKNHGGDNTKWIPLFKELIDNNQASYITFLDSYIFTISTKTIFNFMKEKIYQDPYYMCSQIPILKKGQYPYK